MPKPKKSIKIRLPEYVSPRNEWRKKIHRAFSNEYYNVKVEYTVSDKFELNIKVYLDKGALEIHDVDNRLKDVMDALQGRIGGPKNVHKYKKFIKNDNQIYKVTIEKLPIRNKSIKSGHLVVKKYKKE